MEFTLLFFLHIFKLFVSSEIVIPFYSKLWEIPKNQTPQEFIQSLTSNELYTTVKIGTPPQEFDFLIDFENYNTFVIKYESVEKRYPRFNNKSLIILQLLRNLEEKYISVLMNSQWQKIHQTL